MEQRRSSLQSDSDGHHGEEEKRTRSVYDIGEKNSSAIFENPLADISKETLLSNVDEFCRIHNLVQYTQDFRKGALISQNPHRVLDIEELSNEDVEHLRREHTHKWSQPWTLYWLVGT